MKKTLLAEFTVHPGSEEHVAELVKEYSQHVRKEPGNLAFEVYTKESDPLAFWIFEAYEDEAAFQAHLAAPYGAPFNAELQPLITEKESVLTFLSPLDVVPGSGRS
ncbi:antibiotic biosynthesis monooxygenase [Streptomyces sp. NBC_01724]|uniref:putative quinol monooxygenase n=1 Tax=unclassified Streptomyces TaxID=2593676 RepID=UPI002E33E29F|nr:putative quinol monooxygenase [Streptomyces sp. NBC_01724]WTE56583.1 antibiotic biosynthesis monooxygenase [Streptomyces sp. NBC_01620]WTE64654.1 antibiotic biosynthesis monooxygenase [Streptomyces sp. NBC_01617]WTI91943.1 antibiotic biosynthesis monooxygenase [Streptomyces sp. NBC_00724]